MNDRLKGVVLTLASNISFSVMAVFIGYLKTVSPYTCALSRFVIGLAVIVIGTMLGMNKLRFVNIKLLSVRGILGGAAIVLYFLTLTKIGLGRATLIAHLYPAFTAIASLYFLKERLTAAKIISFFFALSGIYVLASAKGMAGSNVHIWDMWALVGAVLSGIAIVTIRKLHTTDTTTAIFFSQCIGGALIVFVPGINNFGTPSLLELSLLLLVGLSATVGQLMMTQGFKYLSAATGSLLHMSVPLLNMIAGILLFNEPFGWPQVAAFVLISCSCAVLVMKRSYADIISTSA